MAPTGHRIIVPLESLVETSSPEAYLCSNCERQIASVSNLEETLAALRAEIRQKLSGLTNVSAVQNSWQNYWANGQRQYTLNYLQLSTLV